MGTEFVIGFLEAMMPDVSPHIYIVGSRRSTSVVIYTKQGNYTLNITPYQPVQSLDLMNAAIAGSEAIVVKADHEVSVYGIDRGNSMDSFLALPTDALGYEYYVVTYELATRIKRDDRGSQFMVISTDHDTRIRINFRPNNYAVCNGQIIYSGREVPLTKLQTLHCLDQDYDLTGTHIVSNKPIAVLSGNKCANVPKNNRYCDHLVEQLPPVSSWEKEFITSPLKGRSHGDRFRVIAARNLTVVRTTTTDSYFILNAGQFRELDVGSNSSTAIVANSPILVMQFSKGGNVDGTGADPFMMLVPGIEQFVSEALIPSISVASGPELTNNINIVIDCNAKSSLFHGIFHFPEDNFLNASHTTEEMLKRKFCIKQHSLVHNPSGVYFLEDRYSGYNSFSVLVYGYSSGEGNEAYGMPAGLVLRNNSCVRRTPARLTSTVPPGIMCTTYGPQLQQISRSDHNVDVVSNFINDHTVSGVQTEPTTGQNLKSPTRGGNYLTVAIIIGMFSFVIITILAVYVCYLKRKIRRLEAERKTFGQLQLSSMLVGPDGYIDLDGSQISQREYMTLNNTDGVWRVGKVRRVDRAMFRSLSATNGKSTSPANRCNGQSGNGEGSFRDRMLTASESAPHDITTTSGIRRQPSTSESCGGMSQANGSTAALISISRQGSISEEPKVDSFPMLRPLGSNRASTKHTSIHIDSELHPDLVPSRRQRKHLWRSVSNPGTNPFSGAHGDLKVYYEVPRNNRPLTTGNVSSSNSSTSQHYDRPRRQRTNSEEISPAASIFLTNFPNSLSSRHDDGYMSMKDPRASVSSQASGSQVGDISHASASTANSMMDKAYSSIPDENFNNANDTGDTDSTDYTELN
ncbi:uncharacterized protein LOC129265457 [Lytechinus pictus]|uniref:uncharacterized protein LOC129265457 n=1 Tax=Lytechinus pictus TaxID=7653 RepID=UPI0030B9EA7B